LAKRTERQKAVAAADKAFSEYIRARDRYICKTCGLAGSKGDGVMTCGHLITRAKYATRWDELNAECQCRGCNMRHEFQPEMMTDLWVDRNGYIAYHELVRKSNKPRKFTTGEVREIAEYYKQKTRELP
jgi:hypothetical protein